jgi:tetratricopeptide (TPR) repeat protein
MKRLSPPLKGLAHLLLLLLCACRVQHEEKTMALTPRAVTMPDISNVAAPVQAQIRQQYASLQQKISSGAPAAELADAYGAMGRLFIATEFFDAADSCFSDAQALQPNDMRWPYYLAHVNRLRNEPAKAATLFERVLVLQPDHVPSLVWLGAMRLVAGDSDGAEAPLSKALALQPKDPAALYQAGRVALAKRQYQVAVDRLSAAANAAPQASSVQYPLSLAYRGLGDVTNADAHLRLRGNVDPAPDDPLMRQVSGLLQSASAFEVRGADALAQRRWPDAVAALRQAIALAPDNAFDHLNLGTALFETGDASGALTQFREAVRLSPGLSKAHYGIGIVTESAGHDSEALDAFSAAVKSDPDDAAARLSLADALRRNGRDAEALPHYAAVITTNPSASPAYFGSAMALVHLKRWVDARDALNRAVVTFPDQPGFAHALARVLAAAPDDRVRDGRRALTITESLLKTQRTLELAQTMAMALAEVGRFDEAVQWQREVIAAAAQSSRRDLSTKLAENLSRYEQRLPCRVPWPEDDPVFRPRPN